MVDKMIIDADLCIKLGGSKKYTFLYDVLPLIAKEIYMHTHARSEVMIPSSAMGQLNKLISEGNVILVDESNLDEMDRAVYDAVYDKLSVVMQDPARPNKNMGEMCSLACAKAIGIPYFATDEKDPQPIIDKQLNTGMDDIACIRIVDIIEMARRGEIELARKVAKAIWLLAGKKKEIFDQQIWSI